MIITLVFGPWIYTAEGKNGNNNNNNNNNAIDNKMEVKVCHLS